MEHMIDWSYYSSIFCNANEEDFPRLLLMAEYKLDVATHMRWKTAEGYKLEQVRFALAHLVDLFALKELNPSENGIKSASNDGYSETYITLAEFKSQLASAISEDLSGTGLTGVL